MTSIISFVSALTEKCSEKSAARKLLWSAVIIGTFLCVFIINCLTVFLADDFYYSRNLVYGENTPVSSISDILRSTANVWIMNSGRLPTHIIYHLFGLTGKAFFNVLNSLAYMGTTFLLYQIIRGTGNTVFQYMWR